jgi:hypothetical protein
MVQQWRDVLVVQITKHMYEDEDEDWFINMLVQENASIAICNTQSMVALDLEDLQIWLKIDNLGMIRFMLTIFLKTMCMMGDYL